jgi:DNA mismatch repair protein MutS
MAKKLTPMMQQYREMRDSLPRDTLLLFRLGDFYEMFEEDAERGAGLLGITLTKRHDMPMAGIPYHAADNYISKILKQGRKVAIVDQIETPQPGKLVKRALTRIITPGTTLEGSQLSENENSFLLALNYTKGTLAASWLDLTTGDFHLAAEKQVGNLLPILSSINPREILVPESFDLAPLDQADHAQAKNLHHLLDSHPVTELGDHDFDPAAATQTVQEALHVRNLQGFGIPQDHPALPCSAALIEYATHTLCARPENISKIQEYSAKKSLIMDPATIRSLEIFRGPDNSRKGSLMEAMDATLTAAGARLLEQYLSAPPLDLAEINRRQSMVEEFFQVPGIAGDLREKLKQIRDIPRILGRLQNRLQNPREVGGIRDTLAQLPGIQQLLRDIRSPHTTELAASLGTFDDLHANLAESIADELPNHLRDGGYVRHGYDSQLDHLRSLGTDSKTWLSNLQAEEQERTGIKNLRIKYNGAFGYCIEVSKAQLALVPDNYIRKQTLTNAERFYTEELKVKEKEILNAEELAIAREEELFRDIVQQILAQADALGQTARHLAEIDLFAGWSHIARQWHYCRPSIQEGGHLHIEQARHPVVEQTLRDQIGSFNTHTSFVPNDCHLTTSDLQIALLTGPNMAGKSTYIRQTALIALMAHTGSWVPAHTCRLGIVDRIFSRVGASDELARGNSTFMVEMNETANILNNSTPKSLIILDEIGRGTSTYDGLSIAWAVIEHLHGTGKQGPRTLFATHYHELTQLRKTLHRVHNYCVAVKEYNDEIIFLHQILEGAADRSYGIQVARLAGLPESVIQRAKTILEKLESGSNKPPKEEHEIPLDPEAEKPAKKPKPQRQPKKKKEPLLGDPPPDTTHEANPGEFQQLELF